MFWLRNEKNNFSVRSLTWRSDVRVNFVLFQLGLSAEVVLHRSVKVNIA